MEKKKLYFYGIIILVVVALLASIGTFKPKQILNNKEQIVTAKDIKIAVVNEDFGTEYNGINIEMGNILLRSFANSQIYDMEIVSRITAERGLDNNYYQLIIILPSTFSKDALELESISPKQAKFRYKIKSDKQVLLKQAEQAVLDFKNSLNKDIIHIYFTSIIGNLQDSQKLLTDIVNNEANSLLYYQNILSLPLKSYSDQFNYISSNSQSALSTFDFFNQQIHNSNQAFNDIASVDRDYSLQVEEINKSQNEWKNSIETREEVIRKYDEDFSKLTVDDPLDKLTEIKEKYLNNLIDNPTWKKLINNIEELKNKLIYLNENIKEKNKKVSNYLDEEYKSKIKNAVKESLDIKKIEKVGTLAFLIQNLKQEIDNYLLWEANNLPIIANRQITESNFGSQYSLLRKINDFLNIFAGLDTDNGKVDVSDAKYQGIKNYIKSKEITDQILLDNILGDISKVIISIPDNYYFTSIQGQEVNENTNEITIESFNDHVIDYSFKLKEDISVDEFYLFESASIKLRVESILTESENYDSNAIENINNQIESFNLLQVDENSSIEDFKAITIPKVEVLAEENRQRHLLIYNFVKNYLLAKGYQNLAKDMTDVVKYAEKYYNFADKLKFFYGIDLANDSFDVNENIVATNNSFYNQLNLSGLADILIDIVSNTLIEKVKNTLQIESMEDKINVLLNDIKIIEERIKQFDLVVENTNTETIRIIEETQKIQKSLLDKPQWIEDKVRENTDMVTVAMELNTELVKLMNASATLMKNTESNQATSESIFSSLSDLNQKVVRLESDGIMLSQQVVDLENVLSTEYNDNKNFLNNFSKVLSNTKNGNAKNEVVYNYLSDPLSALNLNTSLASNLNQTHDFNFGLLIIMICYMICLVCAYCVQSINIDKLRKKNPISRISFKNSVLPLIIQLGFAFLLAIILVIVLTINLKLNFLSIITTLIVLFYISTTFMLLNNLLLRNLKAIGMIISVSMLILFIIANSNFFITANEKLSQIIANFTILSYAEKLFTQWLKHGNISYISLLIVGIVLVISFVVNLISYRKVELFGEEL